MTKPSANTVPTADLRKPHRHESVTEHFAGSGFKVFANMIASNPKVEVWAIPAKDRRFPRLLRPHECLGAEPGPAGPGLYFLEGRRGKVAGSGPLAKNIGEERTAAIAAQLVSVRATLASSWPVSLRVSTSSPVRRRNRAADELNLIDRDRYEFCWIVDFPFYE